MKQITEGDHLAESLRSASLFTVLEMKCVAVLLSSRLLLSCFTLMKASGAGFREKPSI